jgi:hypothetical protein
MKKRVVDQMSRYFQSKGYILNTVEYMKAKDGPVSLPAIKRSCGSWARMVALCKSAHPDRVTFGEQLVVVEKPVIVKREPVTAAEALARLEGTYE